MRILLIVHANSWSDKTCSAKPSIEQLINSGDYDRIIEVASKHPDAYDSRYLIHSGSILEHQGISPVPFFEADLFGENAMFPIADEVTLAGGVLNASGGGCLNYAFKYLIDFQHRLGRACRIEIPISAAYRADGEDWDEFAVEQVAKDLAWKMLVAGIPFALTVKTGLNVVTGSQEPLLSVVVDNTTITR